jgi:hypothetical protein
MHSRYMLPIIRKHPETNQLLEIDIHLKYTIKKAIRISLKYLISNKYMIADHHHKRIKPNKKYFNSANNNKMVFMYLVIVILPY